MKRKRTIIETLLDSITRVHGSNQRPHRRPTKKKITRKGNKFEITSLPDDIIFEIFLRLPADYLTRRLQFMCKSFYKLIHDPIFVRQHVANAPRRLLVQVHEVSFQTDTKVNLYTLEVQPLSGHIRATPFVNISANDFNGLGTFKICASSHGLLLLDFMFLRDHILMVINPITKHHCLLPKPPIGLSNTCFYGFTFDATTNCHKVVHLFKANEGAPLCCGVFTLGSHKWCLINPPEHATPTALTYINPVSIGGLVHWVDGQISNPDHLRKLSLMSMPAFDPSRHGIISFDVTTERFRRTHLPIESWGRARLVEIWGRLGLIYCSDTQVDIWVLKNYESEVWVKRHSTTNRNLVRQLGNSALELHCYATTSLNDGNVIIFVSEHRIYRYDFELDEYNEVKSHKKTIFGKNRRPPYLRKTARPLIFLFPCHHVDSLVVVPNSN